MMRSALGVTDNVFQVNTNASYECTCKEICIGLYQFCGTSPQATHQHFSSSITLLNFSYPFLTECKLLDSCLVSWRRKECRKH